MESALWRQISSAFSKPPTRPVARHLRLATRGVTPYSTTHVNSDHSLQSDLFEGYNKHGWMDARRAWCHLCNEPIGTALSIHVGDRDHMNMTLMLFVAATYPRQNNPRATVTDARLYLRRLGVVPFEGGKIGTEKFHATADLRRRQELRALLSHVMRDGLVGDSLRGNAQPAHAASGEKMMKDEMTRHVVRAFPPMSAGQMTQLTHKCWGRTNLERLYDALHLDALRSPEKPVLTTKDAKGSVMRQLFFELFSALARVHEVGIECQLRSLILDEVVRRLCFELVFLQSMAYMAAVNNVWEQLEYPQQQGVELMGLN